MPAFAAMKPQAGTIAPRHVSEPMQPFPWLDVAIIMALILYTLTLDKLHSIALLKLIGAPNRVILGLILQQAIALGGIGYGIAYLVGQKLFPYFPRRVVLTDQDLLQLAAIVLGISVLSSFLGIWKAMSIQPNEILS